MASLRAGPDGMPRLARRAAALNEATRIALDFAHLPPLGGYVSASFVDLMRLIGRVARNQARLVDDLVEAEEDRLQVLDAMHALMSQLGAFGEGLKQIIHHAFGEARPGVRSRTGRIDARLQRLVKLPINDIKHRAFRMEWLVFRDDRGGAAGYCVRGPVAPGKNAPIKFKKGDRDSPEAYSFGYVLRDCALMPYDLCAIAEDALDHVGAFRSSLNASEEPKPMAEALQRTLTAVNALPLRGFPEEIGRTVPWFEVGPLGVKAANRRMRGFGAVRITSALNGVGEGIEYAMPYMGRRD